MKNLIKTTAILSSIFAVCFVLYSFRNLTFFNSSVEFEKSSCSCSSALGGSCSANCPDFHKAVCDCGIFSSDCKCVKELGNGGGGIGGDVHILPARKELAMEFAAMIIKLHNPALSRIDMQMREMVSAAENNNSKEYNALARKIESDLAKLSAEEKQRCNEWLASRGIEERL